MRLIGKIAITFIAPLLTAVLLIVGDALYQDWLRGPKGKITFDYYPSLSEQIFGTLIFGLVLLSIVLPVLILLRERQRSRDESTRMIT